jgi:hypothetical protein
MKPMKDIPIKPPKNARVLIEAVTNGIITLRLQENSFKIEGKLLHLPDEGELIIVGDIHGDLDGFTTILKETNFVNRVKKGETLYLLCLGDYIDRGPKQIEILYALLHLLNNYPEYVILLRGNHEGPKDVRPSPHDFPQHLRYHYGEVGVQVYQYFQRFFDSLYNASFLQERALFLHGGIPTKAQGLQEIAYAHKNHPEESHLVEILWNDPSNISGILPNPRGTGKLFGPDITRNFLSKIRVNLLIRGHQAIGNGYNLKDRILTLFSCKLPHYTNKDAAYLKLDLAKPVNKDTVKWFITTF